MRYVMKQKLFSWGDDFVIRDESERDAFFVDGRAFSLGKQLWFQDMAGNELAFIRQKLLSWGPTYEIHRDGQLYAVVKKELFTLFRCRFTVDVPGPDDLEAEGDFMVTSTHSTEAERRLPGCPSAGLRGPTHTAWTSLMVKTTCSFSPVRS